MNRTASATVAPGSAAPRARGGEGSGERINGIQVIARAASILRALESNRDGMSLGEIARHVGLARSTVQRIVNALVTEGFVSAGGARSLRIGPALAKLASAAGDNIAERVAPHLRALGEDVGETVDLALLSGGSAVFVDQVAGRHRLVALSAVGERFPLHCTANGKAILACFSPEDAEELLDKSLAEHPQHKLKNRKALLRELEDTRASKLAFDLGEHGEGICAVGTALLDGFGRPLAISVPVPAQRFDDVRDDVAKKLRDFRERIKAVVRK